MNIGATDGVQVEGQLRQVLYRYCRGVDRCDRDLIVSCFDPAALVDYTGIVTGSPADFADFVISAHSVMLATSHLIGNVLVEIANSGITSESYGFIVLWKPDGDRIREVLIRNRYLDRWISVDGRWLISERRQIIDLRTVDGRPDASILLHQPHGDARVPVHVP